MTEIGMILAEIIMKCTNQMGFANCLCTKERRHHAVLRRSPYANCSSKKGLLSHFWHGGVHSLTRRSHILNNVYEKCILVIRDRRVWLRYDSVHTPSRIISFYTLVVRVAKRFGDFSDKNRHNTVHSEIKVYTRVPGWYCRALEDIRRTYWTIHSPTKAYLPYRSHIQAHGL